MKWGRWGLSRCYIIRMVSTHHLIRSKPHDHGFLCSYFISVICFIYVLFLYYRITLRARALFSSLFSFLCHHKMNFFFEGEIWGRCLLWHIYIMRRWDCNLQFMSKRLQINKYRWGEAEKESFISDFLNIVPKARIICVAF